MAKRKNDPVKVMVKGKERALTGKRSYPQNLLEAFEKIIDAAKDSELSDDFFITVESDVRYISSVLNITSLQAVFLSFFIYKCEDTRIRPSEIAEFFGINTIRMLKYMDEIDYLVKLRYIKTSKRHDDTTYKVPPQVIKCMRLNKPLVYEV